MTRREIQIQIPTPDGETLEGRLIQAATNRYAAICHPHPLYGGNMDNNVVLAVRDTLVEIGFGALRFNFRSVGRSTGQFGGGNGEAIDVAAACRYLEDRQHATEIHAVAYSFGSVAFLKAIGNGLQVKSAALVSPPVTSVDMADLVLPRSPCIAIAGDTDQHCNRPDLDNWLEYQPKTKYEPQKVILPNTDHFYWGSEQKLQRALRDFFRGSPKTE